MRRRFRLSAIGLAALGALCLFAIPSLLQFIGDPADAATPAATIIAGPNGGRAICSETVAGPFDKRVICLLVGYQNAGSTPQDYVYPASFEHGPALLITVVGGEYPTAVSMPLPVNMSHPMTGWIIVGGF